MTLMLNPEPTPAEARPTDTAWPAEVEFIMSALEAAGNGSPERRQGGRVIHHALGKLRLFSDPRGAAAWELYSRDATPRSMGFITRHRLPLGYGGVLTLVGPDGDEMAIECSVRRCRETVKGWFEGSLSFNREQFAFKPDADRHDESPRIAGCIFRDATA